MVGANVTEIVQCPPAATVPPQLFVSAKPEFAVTAMPLIVIAEGPVLVKIAVCAVLVVLTVAVNVKEAGVSVDVSVTEPVPVPLSLMVEGELDALLVSTIVPGLAPSAVGVNVTPRVQSAPEAMPAVRLQVPPLMA